MSNKAFIIAMLVIFGVIVVMVVTDHFALNTFITEIYDSPEGSFEYKGIHYYRCEGYLKGFDTADDKMWKKIGKTDKWENIYIPFNESSRERPSDLIYIDGEKPALFISESSEIPVSGEKTCIFVYNDPEDHAHYSCSNSEITISLMEKLIASKGVLNEYQTEDIRKSCEYFSFAYNNCMAGADESEKYLVCRIDKGRYVFVPEYKKNVVVNDDDSAELYGIEINDEEIIQYLDYSHLFFNEPLK